MYIYCGECTRSSHGHDIGGTIFGLGANRLFPATQQNGRVRHARCPKREKGPRSIVALFICSVTSCFAYALIATQLGPMALLASSRATSTCGRSSKASRATTVRVACAANASRQFASAAAAAVASATLAFAAPALADLNVYEAATGGEFGIGSAQQYGEADIQGKDFSGQDLRRSNFTSADCRNANFKGANLQGAYFIKAVTFRTNFEDANLSDVLMDRATMVEANLRNAVLQRAVFTRSDLTGAIVEGADFTNALLDKTQQMALCKYADGTNPVTGVNTRKSLGCGSARRFRASTPSNPDGPQVSEDEKEAFRSTINTYRG